ncbi:MAG: hypothetical protein IPM39_29255 [Chloroflexi bacterium]|nr:hypothetical protein [Chloroflexota bacterium]
MDEKTVTPADELLLLAYLDGDLPPDQHAALTARLTQEPALAAVLFRWRTLDAELSALPEPRLSHDLTAGVLARLDAPVSLPARAWRSLVAGQAVVALLVMLLAWPLLATWSALRPALPGWLSAPSTTWMAFSQRWPTWAATAWTPELWSARWATAWQGLDQAWLSLSWLLPLALVAAILWFVSVRAIWHSAPVNGYKKG